MADNQEPGQNMKWASKTALNGMNKTERFEHTMPFHTLRVDIFEMLGAKEQMSWIENMKRGIYRIALWEKSKCLRSKVQPLTQDTKGENVSGRKWLSRKCLR